MLNLNKISFNSKKYSTKILNLIIFNKKYKFNIATGFVIDTSELKDIDNIDLSVLNQTKKYIVRSAAFGEDAENASFAGIFKSIQDVDVNNIKEAIKIVNESFYSKKSLIYQKLKNVYIKPQILIQEMIESKYSIVIFIKNNKIDFSFIEGNCSQIVSGVKNVKEFSFFIDDLKKVKEELYKNKIYKKMKLIEFIEQLIILKKNFKEKKSIDIEATYDGDKWFLLQYRELNI